MALEQLLFSCPGLEGTKVICICSKLMGRISVQTSGNYTAFRFSLTMETLHKKFEPVS